MDRPELIALRARKTYLAAAIEHEDAERGLGWEVLVEELSIEASAVDASLALPGALQSAGAV